jgi:WD40 repeat protein
VGDNDLVLEATFEGSTEPMRVGVILLEKDLIRLTYTKSGMSYALKRSAAAKLHAPALVRPLLSLDTGLDGSQFDKGVHALAVSADGRVVVAQGRGQANKVVVWDVVQPRQLHEFPNPSSQDRPVAVSADGKVLTYPTGWDDVEGVVLREVESGKELRRLKRKEGDIRLLKGLAFSPAGDLLVAAADGGVVGWDPRTGEQRFAWEGDAELVTALSAFFEAGKKIASGGQDGTVKVWDVATGRVVCTLAEERAQPPEERAQPPEDIILPYGNVRSIAASEDGKTIVSAAYTDLTAPSEPIAIWDVAAGKVVKRLPASRSSKVALLPDRKTLVYQNVTTVHLDNLETGVRGHVLRGHEGYVSCLALTPDGSRLVTGSNDKTIKVWDLKALP